MTKKMFFAAVTVVLVLTSTLAFGQVMPRGTNPPKITPLPTQPTPLPAVPLPEVQAYLSLTSTQSAAGNLNTIISQAETTACATQLAILQQAAAAIGSVYTQLSSAWTEYDSQMALPYAQRNWTNFWTIMSAAQAGMDAANGYYSQSTETPC